VYAMLLLMPVPRRRIRTPRPCVPAARALTLGA
jgi:hypothetical protein